MTNTLKITLTDDKYPIVERYQDNVKIGEKKVKKDDLIENFISLTPVDKILYSLMKSKLDELELYLQSITDVEPLGNEFISVILQSLPFTLKNNSKIKETIELVFELANEEMLSDEQFNALVLSWGQQINKVSELTEQHIDIMETILKKSFSNNTDVGIKMRLAKFYKDLLYLIEDSEVKDWVIGHLDHVPLHELKEIVQKQEKSSSKTVIYNMGKVPKNAAFVASTSNGLTYFYDLPMAQYSVKYADVRFNDVGHPRLLFAISVGNDGRIQTIKLGALKSADTLDGDTVIYKYPYSNVFGTGTVCWNDYHDLEIDTIPMMFLSAPNNSHLGNTTLELFKRFENQPFAEDLLGEGKWKLSQWL